MRKDILIFTPWFIAMGILLAGSAFFSLSEAALFYLNREQRSRFAAGNRAQRLAVQLLRDADRLLSGVLFCNLIVNIAYFALASIVSMELQSVGSGAGAGAVALGAFLALILLGEMLPKSLAVISPTLMAPIVAYPLAAVLRFVDPVLPVLRAISVISRRVVWPDFQPEEDVRVRDLERAVDWSTTDRALLRHEQQVLRSIVLLSEIRADELMRPRIRIKFFKPPVSLADLGGEIPPSGYLLITEPASDELALSVPLYRLSYLPEDHLERFGEPVVYVPWCVSAARVLEQLRREQVEVAAVINEFGETIGVLTMADLLETIFRPDTSRSQRLLRRAPIEQVAPGVWRVTGMTSLRRLERHFNLPGPARRSVTVAGIIQELLDRLPQEGDRCRWGPYLFEVVDVPERGHLVVELRLSRPDEDQIK